MSGSLQPHGLKHTRFLCSSLSSRVYSNSCPLGRWCHLTISSSAASFSFWCPSFPASGSFPMSWLFTSSGQSIGVSASASGFPMNIQGWFPLGLASLISLLSRGLSRVCSSTIRKHQFFGTQPSLWSNSHWAIGMILWLLSALILYIFKCKYNLIEVKKSKNGAVVPFAA